ncbi:MAG: MFS transporter [Gaiellaceae bacterium]
MTSLVRQREFRKLWAAQSVSELGSQISAIALPLVAVIELHATPFRVALLGTFDMLPFLLFALPAGVWIDRAARRPVLVAADAGRALALGSIPVAAVFGSVTIWQLYAVGFTVGTLTVFFDVAYQSFLPSLVGREHLVEGNSKLELSRSAAQIAGPGAGGLLVGAITAPYAIVADALSFVWSSALVGLIRTPEPRRALAGAASMRVELVEGLRYVLGDPRWRALTAYVATFNFGTGVTFSLVVVYFVRHLGLSPGEIGLVFALGNVGWLLGAVFARRVSTRFGIGPTLMGAGALSGVPILLIPFAPRSFPIPLLVASQVLTALGIVLYNVTAISLIQTLTPDRLLGRANASRRWIVWGTIPLGSLAGGGLASTLGVRSTILAGAIVSSLAFVFMLAKPLRSIATATVPGDAGAAGDGGVAAPAE